MPDGDENDRANFKPPEIPTEVGCIHCGACYDSWRIEWREGAGPPGLLGAWCCPTPGCDGVGFLFDIWPTDPQWRDENGELVCFGGDEEDDEEEDDEYHGEENEFDEDGESGFDPLLDDPDRPSWRGGMTAEEFEASGEDDLFAEDSDNTAPQPRPKPPDELDDDEDIPF